MCQIGQISLLFTSFLVSIASGAPPTQLNRRPEDKEPFAFGNPVKLRQYSSEFFLPSTWINKRYSLPELPLKGFEVYAHGRDSDREMAMAFQIWQENRTSSDSQYRLLYQQEYTLMPYYSRKYGIKPSFQFRIPPNSYLGWTFRDYFDPISYDRQRAHPELVQHGKAVAFFDRIRGNRWALQAAVQAVQHKPCAPKQQSRTVTYHKEANAAPHVVGERYRLSSQSGNTIHSIGVLVEPAADDCLRDKLGLTYAGNRNSGSMSPTSLGTSTKRCVAWNHPELTWPSTDVRNRILRPQNFPDGNYRHNNCRNPDRDTRGPWCYIEGAKTRGVRGVGKRFIYCKIPPCAELQNPAKPGPGAPTVPVWPPRPGPDPRPPSGPDPQPQPPNGRPPTQPGPSGPVVPPAVNRECRNDTAGLSYQGSKDIARDGQPCLFWNDEGIYFKTQAHRERYRNPDNFPGGNMHHNHCRNPDKDNNGPWCYLAGAKSSNVGGLGRRWQYCRIPVCRTGIETGSTLERAVKRQLVRFPSLNASQPQTCGTRMYPDIYETRVMGGTVSREGEWPWLVRLTSTYLCGATLINNQWIVTAAHCFFTETGLFYGEPRRWRAIVGERDARRNEKWDEEIYLSKIKTHPRYNRRYARYDIAVAKLRSPARLNNYVTPACLSPRRSQFPSGTWCYVAGWGYGGTHGPSKPSRLANHVSLQIISNRECARKLRRTVPSNQMCAYYPNQPGRDSCKGDSGGPLMCHDRESDQWVLVGVVSHGKKCGDPRYPGVYMRVDRFMDFLTSAMVDD